MIRDYLRAGYPALCLLTQEPTRIQQTIPCDGWQFVAWDCIDGIRDAANNSFIDEIRGPIEALRWLSTCSNTVMFAHNLHLFLESPEIIQAIQNGVVRWKATGCALCLVAPFVKMPLELEKLFHLIDIPLPDYGNMITLQQEIGKSFDAEIDTAAAYGARGLTEFEAETAYALSLVRTGKFSPEAIAEAKGQWTQRQRPNPKVRRISTLTFN